MEFKQLREFLDTYLSMLGVPGSDTVIYLNHEEIFRHTTGYDNIETKSKLSPDALYNLYSCTKLSTVVSTMQLLEGGEILLTDPVYAYIPEFRNITVKDGENVRAAKSPILIKHLLSMTSGLDYNLNRPALKELYLRSNGRCPTVEFAAALAKDPLCFDPGTQYNYSLSHDVLGAIIEVVSGMRLSEYMRKNITTMVLTDSVRERLATQYNFDQNTGKAIEIPKDYNMYRYGSETESGGAGIISSAADYAVFADALAMGGIGKNGQRIVSGASIKLLRQNMLTEIQRETFARRQNTGYGYGLGVRTNMYPEEAGNLAPVGQFGWDGAKGSIIEICPELKLSVFHAQHMGGLHSIIAPRMRNIIYSEIGKEI